MSWPRGCPWIDNVERSVMALGEPLRHRDRRYLLKGTTLR
jgi:hypothetical protein